MSNPALVTLFKHMSWANNSVFTALSELPEEALTLSAWDPEWKVEYALDGKKMGSPAQQKGFDPLSITLYKGDQLPAGRTFPEPAENDHLFVANLNPDVKKIKVTVTDRFGNKYEQVANA